MAEFLVELYVSRMDPSAVSRGAQRARDVAEERSRHGVPVRCLSWIFIPEEETCLLLFEAASADAVRTVVGHAGLPLGHLAEVVAESNTEGNQPCPS